MALRSSPPRGRSSSASSSDSPSAASKPGWARSSSSSSSWIPTRKPGAKGIGISNPPITITWTTRFWGQHASSRCSEGLLHLLYAQVRRARGQLLPHPPELAPRGRHPRLRRGSRLLPDVRELPGGPARLPARVHAVLRPEHQLLQALREGLLRPDGGRLGQGQPHLLDACRRARWFSQGREPSGGWGREPLPGNRGHDRRRSARYGKRTALGGGVRRQRLRGRQAARTDEPARGATALRKERDGPQCVRRGGSRALPEHGARRDRSLRGRRYRLGTLPELRASVKARSRPNIGAKAATERVSPR